MVGCLPRRVEQILVVEDSGPLRRTLEVALSQRFRVQSVASVAEARAVLAQATPDLLLIDFALPDGNAFEILRLVRAGQAAAPLIIAMSGEASPEQSFELAAHGVQVYLGKPLTLEMVEAAIERAAAMPSALDQQLRQEVGRKPLQDVEAAVRETMVDEALARSRGGRRAAARLLRVSRQLLQHILRRKDDAAK